MFVYVYVCVVLCKVAALRRADPRPRSPADCLRLRNKSEAKRFKDALRSKWEQQEQR
jgi:hypothetical protein